MMSTTTIKSRTTTTVKTRPATDEVDGDDDSNLMCQGDECGWQDAGAEGRQELHEIIKIIILIKTLTVPFNL